MESSSERGGMEKVLFNNREFDTEHEAICSALFDKYGWRWERPKQPVRGWLPDFRLRGDTEVLVECKGGLEWDDVRSFHELQRYEDAVIGTECDVLLIPKSPKKLSDNGFAVHALGYLYDREVWSLAELGRWSGDVGFCHRANAWRDRISGHNTGTTTGDGQPPDVVLDWRFANEIFRGKRVSFFKESKNSKVEVWHTYRDQKSLDESPF